MAESTLKIRRSSNGNGNKKIKKVKTKNIKQNKTKKVSPEGFKRILTFLFGNKDKAKNTTIAVLTCGLVITSSMYREAKEDINELVTKFNQVEYSVKNGEVAEENNAEVEKTTHNIIVPAECNTDPVGEAKNLKEKTFEIISNAGFKVADGVGGADHQLINDSATKNKIMDQIEKELGRTDSNLFNPLDVRQISGLTEEQFKKLLPEALKEVAPVLYQAEHSDKPINGVFLMSICRLESNDGTSELARTRNNIAGLNARDKDRGTDAYGSKFASKSESANELVRKIRDEYIYSDTDFRANGVSVYDVNKKYCSMCTWSYKVIDRAKDSEKNYITNNL